jgi:hypothetical protein
MSADASLLHTPVTDPGMWGPWARLDTVDPAVIPQIVRGLVVHMDLVPAAALDSRVDEPRLKSVADMLCRLHELDPAPLTRPRSVEHRLIGHCRQSSVLASAMYRESDVPARARCGFAKYYADGRDFFGDHWVVEVRDHGRWQLVDTELGDEALAQHGISFDPEDVPRDQFILGGQAWLDCRSSTASPLTFGPYPGQTGLLEVALQVVRDTWCVVGVEPGPFDRTADDGLATDHAHLVDELARATVRPEVAKEDLTGLVSGHAELVLR